MGDFGQSQARRKCSNRLFCKQKHVYLLVKVCKNLTHWQKILQYNFLFQHCQNQSIQQSELKTEATLF